ncbi:MAG: hypothetical protein AB1758_13140 [Candidatus Eremiobacterota bacterium]
MTDRPTLTLATPVAPRYPDLTQARDFEVMKQVVNSVASASLEIAERYIPWDQHAEDANQAQNHVVLPHEPDREDHPADGPPSLETGTEVRWDASGELSRVRQVDWDAGSGGVLRETCYERESERISSFKLVERGQSFLVYFDQRSGTLSWEHPGD